MFGHPRTPRFLAASATAAFAALALTSCGDDAGQGTIMLHLTDAPFPFEFVASTEVVIDSVAVKIDDSGGEDDGFITIDRGPHVIDLLELQNGVTVPLGTGLVPEGDLTQARIYTGEATITLTDLRTFPLNFPSGSSSGVKVFPSPPIAIPDGETVEVLLDFDLSQSFSAIPNAPTRAEDITSFQFHPVFRVTNLVDVGAVSGTVRDNFGTVDTADDAPLADATIVVTQGLTEIATSSTDAAGEYTILGLLPGDYTVTASKVGFTAAFAPVTITAAHETEGVDLLLPRVP